MHSSLQGTAMCLASFILSESSAFQPGSKNIEWQCCHKAQTLGDFHHALELVSMLTKLKNFLVLLSSTHLGLMALYLVPNVFLASMSIF